MNGTPIEAGAALGEWLARGRRLHRRDMVLEVTRCATVARRLGALPLPFPVVTVAGTNGKGSCVALIEAMLKASGVRVGSYLSPHLVHFSETVRVQGRELDDASLCAAFARVEAVRAAVPLTRFEFQTLAAVEALRAAGVEAAVLEVGIGGRDDAVNVFEPDVALVTNVSIDHVRWLGDTREQIASHKAGILRPGKPAVFGGPDPPAALRAHAAAIGAPLYRSGREFVAETRQGSWTWRDAGAVYPNLPLPASGASFRYDNAAAAIMAMRLLPRRLRASPEQVAQALAAPALPARQQILAGEVEKIIDVAHNLEAVRALGSAVRARSAGGRTLSVFSMLGDKDVAGATGCMRNVVDEWFVSGLPGSRGLDAADLVAKMAPGIRPSVHRDVGSAYRAACEAARPGDRIVVWGSFHTARAAFEGEGRPPPVGG